MLLVPDAGHAVPLLRIASAMSARNAVVRVFGPEELVPLCRDYRIEVVSLGKFLSPEALDARSTFVGARLRPRGDIGEVELYHAAVEVEAMKSIQTLKGELLRFKPEAILVDEDGSEAICTAIARLLEVPIITHLASGTHFRFLSPASGILSGSNATFNRLFGIGKERTLRRRICFATQILLVILTKVLRRLRHLGSSGCVKLQCVADRHYEEAFPALVPLSFNEFEERGGVRIRISTGLALLEMSTLGDACPALPDRLHAFGPIDSASYAPLTESLEYWIEAVQNRPIIYISFGTMLHITPRMLDQITHLAETTDVAILWGISGALRLWPSPVNSVSRYVRIEEHLPQTTLLRHPKIKASINHAGSGVIQECLLNAKPMICIPCIWDQFYNASFVEALGAGINLEYLNLKRGILANAVYSVVHERSYTLAATEIAAKLRAQRGNDELLSFLSKTVVSNAPRPEGTDWMAWNSQKAHQDSESSNKKPDNASRHSVPSTDILAPNSYGNLPKNIGYKLIEAISLMACTLGQYILLTYMLPPESVGTMALTATVVTFITCLSLSGGISGIVTRGIAQNREPKKLVTNSLLLQLGIVSLLAVILFSTIAILNLTQTTRQTILFASLIVLIGLPLILSEAILAGRDHLGAVAVSNVMANIATFVAFWFGLINEYSLPILTVFINSGAVFCGLYAYFRAPLHRYFSLRCASKEEIFSIVRESIPGLITMMATVLYVRIDILMIEWFLGREEVGLYSATYSILDTLMILSNTVLAAFHPAIFRLAIQSKQAFYSFYLRVLKFVITGFFPIALGIGFFAEDVLGFLFTQEYSTAAATLRILMVATFFAWLNGPSGAVLFARRRQHLYMWAAILGAAVNISGNLILIPKLGAMGAAIATAITELTLFSFSFLMIRRLRHVD